MSTHLKKPGIGFPRNLQISDSHTRKGHDVLLTSCRDWLLLRSRLEEQEELMSTATKIIIDETQEQSLLRTQALEVEVNKNMRSLHVRIRFRIAVYHVISLIRAAKIKERLAWNHTLIRYHETKP